MKKFKFLTMLFTALLMCVPLASCSNDDDGDDEGNGNGGSANNAPGTNAPGTNTPLINEGKLLLTKVNVIGSDGEIDGSINMEYDSNRRAHRCYKNYDNESEDIFVIDYANGKITLYGDEPISASISFNNNGYITNIKGTWDDTEDGVRYYGSEDVSFTYSQDGHLTEVNIIGEDHGGEWESGKEISKITYTWDNGNLLSVKDYTTWYNEDGSIDEIDESITEYTYGEQGNRFKQYTAGTSDVDDEPFLVIGMCGVGPAMLPVGRKYSSKYIYNGMTHEHSYSYTYTYTLNENGSINTETETYSDNTSYSSSETYAFVYTSSDSYTPTKTTASNAIQTKTTAVSNGLRTRAFLKSLPFVPQRKSKQDKAL